LIFNLNQVHVNKACVVSHGMLAMNVCVSHLYIL